MDWWTKLEGGGGEVLHLRPSHDQVAGDLLERRALHWSHCQGSTGQTVDETMLPRRRANKSQLRHFSYWPRRIGSVGTRGPGRGVSGARRGLRHEGAMQEGGRGERNKRERGSCWKSGGGRVRLYTW
jgi:hypothetical protein